MIYLLYFLFILFCAIRFDFCKSKIANQYFYAIFLLLVALAGFRYRVGTDTLVYMDEYDMSLSFIKDKYLIGWYLFIKLCRFLHLSFYSVQFIIAIVINYGIFKFLRKNETTALFSALLLYYSLLYPGWNFEVLRQAICVSVFLLTLPLLDSGKYIKYYILVAICCTIHETALLLLPIPFIYKIKITKKTFRIFVVIVAGVIISAPFIRDAIFSYSLLLLPFQDKAAYYFKDVDLTENIDLLSYVFNILLNIVIPLIAIYKNINAQKYSNGFMILALVSVVTYAISTMLPMMYRLSFYFSPFSLILFIPILEDISKWISNKKFKPIFILLLLILILFKGRTYFVEKNGTMVYMRYYPYTSIVNEVKIPQRENFDTHD